MTNWVLLNENGEVINCVVGNPDDPNEDNGYQWLVSNLGGNWVNLETFKNTSS